MYSEECAGVTLGSWMCFKGCIFVTRDHTMFTILLNVDS